MTAPRPERRRTFTLTQVEVTAYADVDEAELRDAGWVYVGTDATPWREHDSAVSRIERWHDEHHQGPWPWCTDELCSDIQRMVRP